MSAREAQLLEVKKRNQRTEAEYENMKQEFNKIRVVISELADVLDAEFPQYVVEEDKTHKFMILGRKENVEAKEDDQIVELEEQLKKKQMERSPFHPFDDEL